MLQSIYNSISGMVAAFNLQSVSAHNVANSNTDSFKNTVARAEEAYQGGVKVTLSQSSKAGEVYDPGDGQPLEMSNTENSTEAVNQIGSKHLLSANIAVLKTADEMNKSIIDLLM